MIPEEDFILIFIELCDPNAVLIRRGLLRHDIHADLCEVQIGANADGRSDAGLL